MTSTIEPSTTTISTTTTESSHCSIGCVGLIEILEEENIRQNEEIERQALEIASQREKIERQSKENARLCEIISKQQEEIAVNSGAISELE